MSRTREKELTIASNSARICLLTAKQTSIGAQEGIQDVYFTRFSAYQAVMLLSARQEADWVVVLF